MLDGDKFLKSEEERELRIDRLIMLLLVITSPNYKLHLSRLDMFGDYYITPLDIGHHYAYFEAYGRVLKERRN